MNRLRHALGGATVGAWAGLMLVYAPVVGAVLFIGFAIPAAIGRSLAAIAGLSLGSGGAILMIIALTMANCVALYGDAGGECRPPDLMGWLVVGGAMLVIGFALASASAKRSRRTEP